MESAPSYSLTRTLARGFTLIEMLVVLAIISIITTMAIVGQATFNQSVFLTDTAYSVALSVREMQSLGLSSRKFSGVQNPGYGLHFSTAAPDSYILFADTSNDAGVPANCPVGDEGTPDEKPGNCLYDFEDPAQSDGLVRTYEFDRGFTVTRFCGKAGLTDYCSNSSTGGQRITDLDITFLRSDTETVINGKAGSWVTLTSAEIEITWPQTDTKRYVCISRIGQVSVSQEECL